MLIKIKTFTVLHDKSVSQHTVFVFTNAMIFMIGYRLAHRFIKI